MKDQRGAALFTVLIVTLVLAVLGAALWQHLVVEYNTQQLDEDCMQAYYLARAGAEAVAQWILQNPDRTLELDGLVSQPKYLDGDPNRKFEVRVNQIGEDTFISATGYVGKTERIVNLRLNLQDVEFKFDKGLSIGHGIFSNEPTVTLAGSAIIKGPIHLGTGSLLFNNIYNNKIEGTLYLGEEAQRPPIEYESRITEGIQDMIMIPPPPVPDLPEFPNAPVYNPYIPGTSEAEHKTSLDPSQPILIPRNSIWYYNNISLGWGKTLEFHLPDGDGILVLDSLTARGGEIKVTGPGHLTLIINDKLDWSGGFNESGNSNQLTLILNQAKVDFPYSAKFKGNLVIPNGTLSTSNAVQISGNVYVGGNSVALGTSNEMRGLIYAPNATFESGNNTNIFGNVTFGGIEATLNGTSLSGELHALSNKAEIKFTGNRSYVGGTVTKIYSRGESVSFSAHVRGEVHLSNENAECLVGSGSTFEGTIYSAGNKIATEGGSKFSGFIYATNPEAVITVNGGSGTDGSIISAGKSVTITGGSHVLKGIIFAPDADVNVSGGSRVVGSIVARTFDGGYDGVPLEYHPIDHKLFPIPIGNQESGDTINRYKKIWLD